jgi:ketosteroid isomerase-like protein
MLRILMLLACLGLLACASTRKDPGFAPNVHLTPGAGAATPELIAEIRALDEALFAAVFDTCDVAALGGMVTEDFEFYHDKGGLTATSREQFVAAIRGTCERQAQGVDFRARRELVPESLQVYPLNNYGAIEVGVHRFYALSPDRPEKLTETGKFTMVWKKEGDAWRLARVLSYDHQLAQ